ncbi:hypothetical protein BJY52DRAFT_1279273 [Lactarius psammicola]|nr:hypothetical protein BJY52DRAFT_1279273 [Lactarius psammicola]
MSRLCVVNIVSYMFHCAQSLFNNVSTIRKWTCHCLHLFTLHFSFDFVFRRSCFTVSFGDVGGDDVDRESSELYVRLKKDRLVYNISCRLHQGSIFNRHLMPCRIFARDRATYTLPSVNADRCRQYKNFVLGIYW